MDNLTTILPSLKDPSVLLSTHPSMLAFIGPQLATIALLTVVLIATRLYRDEDPYNLKSIPKLPRSRIIDYSKKGKPFKFWIISLQKWVYVLPPEYLERIKNQSGPTLSLREVVNQVIPDLLDQSVAQVGSKLLNANLADMDPLLHGRTEQILDKKIGRPREWKRVKGCTLAQNMTKHVSGRIVFGENLVENDYFCEAMERYSLNIVSYAFLARRLNVWPLNKLVNAFLQRRLNRNLVIVTRFVAEEIDKRKKKLEENPDASPPLDCIQWALEQEPPGQQATPEVIAQRLARATSGLISTPPDTVLNLFFDAALHRDCVEEIRAEIKQVLAETGSGWGETSLSKMKKLDSFIQESVRLATSLAPLTGWRLVMGDSFRFSDTFTLPKGSIITFPTYYMRLDPNTYADPEKFDGLRFYKMKQEEEPADQKQTNLTRSIIIVRKATRHRSLLFGYGRQACPGRFYAIRMLKHMLGEMILRYDIRYAGGEQKKPVAWDVEPFFVADETVELEFRARE
ncbi:cytochrome P450 [Aspergillus egyptiacus]|nr:cytochrome P450 [Aspergillus egyptiacus]